MKAWQLGIPKFALIDIDAPKKRVEDRLSSVLCEWESCGTDISCYLGKFPFDYPRIPGHELGIEVLEVGEGVENVKPGDLCSVGPILIAENVMPVEKIRGTAAKT